MLIADVFSFSLHCHAVPNLIRMLSHILFCNIAKLFPILKHCWCVPCLKTLLKKSQNSTLHGTLGKKITLKKLPENMFKTRLGTFGIDFVSFWNFENFLIFLKIFEDSTLHGTVGKTITLKQLPENMFKTCLGTFGIDFGNFWNFENFLIFLKIFEASTLHGTLGKNYFETIARKHVPNTCGHFWERFWAFLEFWKSFDFFEIFRRLDPPWNTGQNFFSRKNYPKTCSKHVWTLLGMILGIFGILKFFLIFFEIFFCVSTSFLKSGKLNWYF